MNDTKTRVLNVLQSVGILIDQEECLHHDLCLKDYIVDSLQFISFIVQIEIEFNITLPDAALLPEVLNSLDGFCALVASISETS